MHRALCLILVLLNITTSSCFFSAGLTRLTRRSCAMTGRRGAALCGLRAQADGEEWALSNEQCDLLQLPRGTKMVRHPTPDLEIRPLEVVHITDRMPWGLSFGTRGARARACVWGAGGQGG